MPEGEASRNHAKGGRRNEARRRRTIRIVQAVVSLVVVALIFVGVLPKIADYSDVWRTLSGLTWTQLLVLVTVTAFNVFSYWPQMVAAMPGLTLTQAAVNNQASTSVANALPGGGAIAVGVTYTMFRSWGFSNSEIGLLSLVTGVWNAFIKLGMPVVALAILAIEGNARFALVIASMVGLAALVVSIALFALVLWKGRFARSIGDALGRAMSFLRRLVRKPPVKGWGKGAVVFRRQTIGLVRRRWIPLTITTIVSHVGLYLVLLIALRDVDVSQGQVTWAQVLGVFAFARLVSAIPITPGGLGVVELSYIAGLVVAGGDHAKVVAAVLLFRALTWGLQIPLGPVAYLVFNRKKSWQKGDIGAGEAGGLEHSAAPASAGRARG